MPLNPGDKAPAFSLPDQDGKILSNDDLRGSKYVLYFYPKDDTRGCTIEACAFNENLSSFQDAKVPVIGVSADDEESHQRFRNKFGLRFTLLADTERKLIDPIGAWGVRGQGTEGVLRSTFIVDEQGVIEKAWHGVKAEGHAEEVLAALQS